MRNTVKLFANLAPKRSHGYPVISTDLSQHKYSGPFAEVIRIPLPLAYRECDWKLGVYHFVSSACKQFRVEVRLSKIPTACSRQTNWATDKTGCGLIRIQKNRVIPSLFPELRSATWATSFADLNLTSSHRIWLNLLSSPPSVHLIGLVSGGRVVERQVNSRNCVRSLVTAISIENRCLRAM